MRSAATVLPGARGRVAPVDERYRRLSLVSRLQPTNGPMRLAMIFAFVSCVFLTTERADARPGGDRTAEAKKAPKRKHAPDARKANLAKSSKAERRSKRAAKVEDDDPVVVDDDDASTRKVPSKRSKDDDRRVASRKSRDDEAPKSEPPSAPKPGGAAVAQATDDETPPDEKHSKKAR